MTPTRAPRWQLAVRFDDVLAALALTLMMAIPLVEMLLRPLLGAGVENASVLVQHLGLVLAMFGAVAAERNGHLSTLGSSLDKLVGPGLQPVVRAFAQGSAALVCGVLAAASARFVASEVQAGHALGAWAAELRRTHQVSQAQHRRGCLAGFEHSCVV